VALHDKFCAGEKLLCPVQLPEGYGIIWAALQITTTDKWLDVRYLSHAKSWLKDIRADLQMYVATMQKQEINPAVGEGDKGAAPLNAVPNFDDWALGLYENNKWVLFKRYGEEWRDQARVTISKGRQTGLLMGFLKHNGQLSKEDALANEKVPSADTTAAKKALRSIKPEISNLRKALRTAMNFPGSADPFYPDGHRGWIAALPIGYAMRDENGNLQFSTPDQDRPG
jgi:hypothetical protein